MRSVFFDVTHADDRATALRESILSLRPDHSSSGAIHRVDPYTFAALPGGVFAYWERPSLISLFDKFESVSERGLASRQGLATADDFRFVRLVWEVDANAKAWNVFAKGGKYSTFYGGVHTVIRLNQGPYEMLANVNALGNVRSNVWMLKGTIAEFFGRPALRWTRTALGGRRVGLGITALPTSGAFNDKSCAVFSSRDDFRELGSLLALLSSSCVDRLFRIVSPTRSWEVGHLRSIPLPTLDGRRRDQLNVLASHGWSARRSLDAAVEVSHAFIVPAVLQVEGARFGERVSEWSAWVASVEDSLVRVQAEIDDLCFELYGISEEDRRAIVEGFGVSDAEADDDGADVDPDDGEEVEVVTLEPAGVAAGLVSWAVGVVVGRFDVRLATGDRSWPEEPDLFDPLPVCSPGMLTGDDGLPSLEPPADYPVLVSPVLVDDPGHGLDMTGRVRAVFEVVFRESADAWWTDVGAALGRRDGEVGGWLGKAFFDHHLKTYSRSRRKAPVLWPIGTKSGSYLVWLYAHRVSADSLFQVLHDIVLPKLGVEERELTHLRQDAGTAPSASQRKAIDAQERLVAELREMRDELETVAPLWAPDLNDGIVVVLAPLWRLFAHHRTWSNELKKHWGKLARGDYDWAQLAMHLWPERVVPKCATDRSLAIAHSLEDVFWVQDSENADKWHARSEPTIGIDQLIAQRHNPAATATLERASI